MGRMLVYSMKAAKRRQSIVLCISHTLGDADILCLHMSMNKCKNVSIDLGVFQFWQVGKFTNTESMKNED